jgi:hypothetical protein
MSDLRYHLNASDEIASVNEEWLSFARGNEAESLLPPRILGRPLWDFIGDEETQHIYRLLHSRVRARGRRLAFLFAATDRAAADSWSSRFQWGRSRGWSIACGLFGRRIAGRC